ncbi:MAG: 3-hydroxyacyl-CoA dehydrogenase NAD-binding domain-containing protein [Rudaea sp.]
MNDGTQYRLHGAVAVITLDNPPVNGLSHAVRTRLVEGIDRALADKAVSAIVLTGGGKLFSGGADIREFNTPKGLAEPTLHTVIRVVEGAAKPVIAAIGGTCFGGGLELSLACHFRVATPDAQIALPEVKLGLLPGAGGTQRLPRAIGVEPALNMILSGAGVPASRFADTRLFDAIVEGDIVEGACRFAERAVGEARPLARLRDVKLHYPAADGYFQFARNTVAAVAKNLPAPAKCIDAVVAAVALPFEAGLARERELFRFLMTTPESRALRHAFFAERAASKIPGIAAGTPARRIEKAGVVGAGTMGVGIALAFLGAGIPVTLLEASPEALEKGVAAIRKHYEGAVAKNRLKPEQAAQALGMLTTTDAYGGLADADVVVEAVFEEMDVKTSVFRALDEVAKSGAILATNTSTLDVDRIAAATRRPQDVLGLHFFSPAHVMKLLEVVRGAKTAEDVLATAMALAKRLRKTAVVSRVCDGFIGNRMIEQYLRQALFAVDEGASPAQVDRALEAFGMAMGPFRMSDLTGNDVSWRIRRRRYNEQPELPYSRVADRLCEQGRFGQKSGAGWYRYEPGRRDALPDPAVDALIAQYRKDVGITPRKLADDEIVERCVLALVNEGARILEEGVAARASDIDIVYLAGYGFPLHRGGPMLYADMLGLYNVVRSMHRIAADPHADPAFWTPAPLLARLAAEGKSFNA